MKMKKIITSTKDDKPIRNVYCDGKDELVVPFRCSVCRKCWLFVSGRKKGNCPFGGPYKGFYEADKE